MKKKILSILLITVLVIGLTGCGNNSNSISVEDKQKIVDEIEWFIVHDSKVNGTDYRASYEANITDIEIDTEDLKATFSGKMKIKYSDGSKNDTITFKGTSSLKPNPYGAFNIDVDYDY